ncbi:MAG: D-alanyl-D-alanine carboxypeptidase [Solirubrobacterales bacterium]|nr:D-alanyl-D-alanine carboxypeptidase [Solirubrobacterales bacterium]HMT04211.1 D-alanyl-D-alanine carboxypeptidase family protein [Solirubrobacterales bacterium]
MKKDKALNGRNLPVAAALAVVLLMLQVGIALGVAETGSAANPEREPRLDAKAWVVIDARTGEPLAGHAENRHLPMASTTKMMTAYLAIKRLPLRKEVKAGDYQGDPAESLMGLEPGQMVSVRDLLYGLMMLSGNDAAVTLAKAVSGTEARFVKLMNRTASRLGLDDTHYNNPVGLDGPSHYTSAADLASLGRDVMAIPRLRSIAGSRVAKLTSYDPPLVIETTDSFLRDNAWARGIKTGHTLKAGYALASDGRKNATELIGAVIGAPTEAARNAETVRLLNYGFSLYEKEVPIKVDSPVTKVPVKYEDADLPLVSKRRVRLGVRQGETLNVSYDLPEEVEGPILAGDRVGYATVRLDGDPYARVPLFAGRTVEKPSLIDRLTGSLLLVIALLVFALFVIIAIVLLVRRHREARARKRLRRVLRTK